jgi:hypothetical protein
MLRGMVVLNPRRLTLSVWLTGAMLVAALVALGIVAAVLASDGVQGFALLFGALCGWFCWDALSRLRRLAKYRRALRSPLDSKAAAVVFAVLFRSAAETKAAALSLRRAGLKVDSDESPFRLHVTVRGPRSDVGDALGYLEELTAPLGGEITTMNLRAA